MNEIALSLVIHDHQPVGNFGWVIEEAYQTAYLPMLACLERHSTVKMALHFTGPLRDWILENEPAFFPRVRTLVENGQVEILGGGYYEPILVSLPQADQIGQLEKLNAAVEEDFGRKPTVAWLAERVWEPHLPGVLHQAGLAGVILDDTHFKAAGLRDADLLGYYLTEDQGQPLAVFPTLKQLRYTIPWSPVEEVIGWLKERAEEPDLTGLYTGRRKLALVGDDGEKFGLWPTTADLVWGRGWLDQFFTAIDENSAWLKTVTPGEFIEENPPLGRIYLPTNSYDEMGEWSMPAEGAYELPALKKALIADRREDIAGYMRGGLWRNFMVKYDEVNQLHKKALRVSRKVHAMPEGPEREKALDHLWAGQCNCGYWHGSFGGIYLFHIREINYRNLLIAEALADQAAGEAGIRIRIEDFDLDGGDDLLIESERQNLIFDLEQGGALVEWDYRPCLTNLINVVTRRREAYHRVLEDGLREGKVHTRGELADLNEQEREEAVLVSEHGLEEKLVYDWHRRAMFIDHFLREGTLIEDYARAAYGEQGDFVNQPYASAADDEQVRLVREGAVWSDGQQLPVRVEKTFTLKEETDELWVEYRISNEAEATLTATFGLELSFGFAGGQSLIGAALLIGEETHAFNELSEWEGIEQLLIRSDLWGVEVAIALDQPGDLWLFPLETISNSGSAYERTYQGSSLLLRWPLALAGGECWSGTIVFSLKEM